MRNIIKIEFMILTTKAQTQSSMQYQASNRFQSPFSLLSGEIHEVLQSDYLFIVYTLGGNEEAKIN